MDETERLKVDCQIFNLIVKYATERVAKVNVPKRRHLGQNIDFVQISVLKNNLYRINPMIRNESFRIILMDLNEEQI